MCGIAGVIKKAGSSQDVRAITGQIMQLIRHRGPDADGMWSDQTGSVALGHTRLSILDLSGEASQPMSSVDGRYKIVFNGEVFNFLEIADQLSARGHKFQTSTDTEVILAAYREWGNAAFSRFNGMWALAIYDTTQHRLTVCRDRFGIKPLYYFHDNELFIFASEVGAILQVIGDRVSPNWDFLNALMEFDTKAYSGDTTFVDGIHSLPGGCYEEIQLFKRHRHRWYTMQRVSVPDNYSDQCDAFRGLFADACKLRLRSDVPVATCLSGGIDSGAIVSVLGRLLKPESDRFSQFTHTAYTAGFPTWEHDEAEPARRLTENVGIKFRLIQMQPPSVAELERAMDACDGPMPALAFYPIWKLYQAIKQDGVSVTLDGQGADEMLGGYFLGYPALRGAMQLGSRRYVHDIQKTYSSLYPDAPDRIAAALKSARRDTHSEWMQKLKRPVKQLLASLGLREMTDGRVRQPPPIPEAIGDSLRDQPDWLHNALWNQFFTTPLPFLLHQYDRCSMASGVECRMPFMDYRLVEFVFSLPPASRIGGGYTKRILRDSLTGILPDFIRTNRIKTGFNAPFGSWMKNDLLEWALDTMSTDAFRTLPNTDLGRLRSELERGDLKRDSEYELWPKLHVAHWLNRKRV